jgi:hypothetical protein
MSVDSQKHASQNHAIDFPPPPELQAAQQALLSEVSHQRHEAY